MKFHPRALFVFLVLASFASATPVTLNDFSALVSPDTFFVGDWEATGDPGGTNSPRTSFSQGVGTFAFAGGSNDASASLFQFLSAPLNISGLSLLELSAMRQPDNAAGTLTVSLFDSSFASAFAVFSLSDFATSGFSLVSSGLTFDAGFNPADLVSFQISGNSVGAPQVLSFEADHLAVAARTAPVPDAGSTLTLLALAAGSLVIVSRRSVPREV